MSDNAQGDGVAAGGVPQTQPGFGAGQQAPFGGDHTPADPAAVESWDDPSFRGKKLDSVFRNGYGSGREKGRREAEEEILRRFGVDSMESLSARLSQHQDPVEPPQQPPSTQQPGQHDDGSSKLIRDLKSERVELQKSLEQAQEKNKYFSSMMDRAMRGEVAAKLSALGAIPDVLDILTDTVCRNLRWSEDGRELEVVDVLADGSVQPTRYELGEFLDEVKKKRQPFFTAPNVSGSGSLPAQGGAAPKPRSPVPRSFQQRLDAYMKRER